MTTQIFLYCDASVSDPIFGSSQCPKYARSSGIDNADEIRSFSQRHQGWTSKKVVDSLGNPEIRDYCPAHSPARYVPAYPAER